MKKHILALTLIAVLAALSIGILSGQASTSSTHIVKPGDTLWDIARNNNVSVEDLISWNGLDSTLIYPSQELKVEKKAEVNVVKKSEVYIIKKGDTLINIAKDHNISLNELIAANNISGHLIYPGDQLTLNTTNKSSPQPKTKTPLATPPVAKTPTPSSPTTKEMSVTATAYTAYCEGCSGTTYTGIDLRSNPNQKVIAVDPSIIPLGSRVWVEGYGEAIAGDIGSAIKGNIIDVFIEKRQDALNWGRKTVTIKILE